MPRIKSAQKRTRQTASRTARNQHVKKLIRLTSQRLKRAVAAKDKPAVAGVRAELDSHLDRAAKKNLIHPRKAARKKSQAAGLARPVTSWSSPRRPAGKPPAKTAAKSPPTKPKPKPAAKK